jgi:hypothetical protein
LQVVVAVVVVVVVVVSVAVAAVAMATGALVVAGLEGALVVEVALVGAPGVVVHPVVGAVVAGRTTQPTGTTPSSRMQW